MGSFRISVAKTRIFTGMSISLNRC